MQTCKIQTTTGYIERPKDGRIGRLQLQLGVVDRDAHAVAVARKKREVMEFLESLRNKSSAK